jgi:hypothetical protein
MKARPTRLPGVDDPQPTVEVVEATSIHPAAVERARVHLRSPILHAHVGSDDPMGPSAIHDGPPVGSLVRASVAEVAPAVIPAAPLALVDWRWALIAVGTLAGARIIRRIGQHVPFGFGDGFVAFRADLGWPHGIQEDDDVHWTWRSNGLADRTGQPVASPR